MKRQKTRKASEPQKTRERILVFDIIRVLCIAIIVYVHSEFFLIPEINNFIFQSGYGPFNIYPLALSGYAVYGMILISGAVLEYNYQGLEKLHGYLQFLFRRLIRIYPAFWMSLIFGLIIFPELWQAGLPRILLEFTGFSVLSGLGTGPVIVIDWFIAAIVSLYLLFPLLSKIIRQYGLWSLAGFCLMSWGLRSVIISSGILPEYRLWMWFPLCNAFEFCLGIYIVQTGWYPKKANTSPIIRELSDLSYYVFIFHTLIIFAFGEYLYPFPKPLAAFDLALASNKVPIAATIFYFQVMITILVVSWITMKIDTRFRSWILQRDAIRNFLNAGNG